MILMAISPRSPPGCDHPVAPERLSRERGHGLEHVSKDLAVFSNFADVSSALWRSTFRSGARSTVLAGEFIELTLQRHLCLGKGTPGDLVFPHEPYRPAVCFEGSLLILVSAAVSLDLSQP